MHKNILMILKQLLIIFIVSSLRINQKLLLFLQKEKYTPQYIQIGLLVGEYHRIQFKGRRENSAPFSFYQTLTVPTKAYVNM